MAGAECDGPLHTLLTKLLGRYAPYLLELIGHYHWAQHDLTEIQSTYQLEI